MLSIVRKRMLQIVQMSILQHREELYTFDVVHPRLHFVRVSNIYYAGNANHPT